MMLWKKCGAYRKEMEAVLDTLKVIHLRLGAVLGVEAAEKC